MQRKRSSDNFNKEENRGSAMIVAIVVTYGCRCVLLIFAACKLCIVFVFGAPGDTEPMPGAFEDDQY